MTTQLLTIAAGRKFVWHLQVPTAMLQSQQLPSSQQSQIAALRRGHQPRHQRKTPIQWHPIEFISTGAGLSWGNYGGTSNALVSTSSSEEHWAEVTFAREEDEEVTSVYDIFSVLLKSFISFTPFMELLGELHSHNHGHISHAHIQTRSDPCNILYIGNGSTSRVQTLWWSFQRWRSILMWPHWNNS